MLESLAHTILRHRKLVVAVWIVLTIIGGFAAPKATSRLLTTFSIPGSSSYQNNQKIVKTFGNGDQNPLVLVLHDPSGDVTQAPGVKDTLAAALKVNPGARISSYFNTGTGSSAYVSRDGHTMFAAIYPVGENGFGSGGTIDATQQAVEQAAPSGVTASITGEDALQLAAGSGSSGGPSILVEVAIGAIGALIILLFVFGTLPAVAMPLLVAMALDPQHVHADLASDLHHRRLGDRRVFGRAGRAGRRDRLLAALSSASARNSARGISVDALTESMIHAGHSIVVSGSTVGIGLLSMVILPIPFIRSIGLGGLLIPVVSVIAACTLLPAMLAHHRYRHQPCARDAAPVHLRRDPDVRAVGAVGAAVTHHAGACRAGPRDRGPANDPRDLAQPRRRAREEPARPGPAITGATAGNQRHLGRALAPLAITVTAPPGPLPTVVSGVADSHGIAGAPAPQAGVERPRP